MKTHLSSNALGSSCACLHKLTTHPGPGLSQTPSALISHLHHTYSCCRAKSIVACIVYDELL